MAAIDIQGLFKDVLPTAEVQDKSEGLRQADLVGTLGGMAAYLAPQRERQLRQGVGGMLGMDLSTPAENASRQLQKLGTPQTAAEHQAYANVLDKVQPGSGVQYMMGVAQEKREAAKAAAATTSADAQMMNAVTNQAALPNELAARHREIDVRQGELELAGQTQENLVDWRDTQDTNAQREFTIKEEKNAIDRLAAETQKGALGAADRAAVRAATEQSREQSKLAVEATRLANEFIGMEHLEGAAGRLEDKWADMWGNQTEIQTIKTQFNALKNKMVMDSLPPGVASDKDIEIAMSGFPDANWDSKQLSEYMRGMAKIAAITSEREGLRAKHLRDNQGMDADFDDEWRAIQAAPGWEAEMANKYGLSWKEQLDEDGKPKRPVSQAEIDRRLAEEAAIEADLERRRQEQDMNDVVNFVNGLNSGGAQ